MPSQFSHGAGGTATEAAGCPRSDEGWRLPDRLSWGEIPAPKLRRSADMELLFSYGTLQQENVQLATFGRRLTGTPDKLLQYEQSLVAIDDPEVVATSGKTHHPIVKHTGNPADTVLGTVFEVTPSELASADAYEVDAYKRVRADLGSGRQAWVYVDARFAPIG